MEILSKYVTKKIFKLNHWRLDWVVLVAWFGQERTQSLASSMPPLVMAKVASFSGRSGLS